MLAILVNRWILAIKGFKDTIDDIGLYGSHLISILNT
jgi:hypothetical protein